MKYAILISALALGMGGATAYSCPNTTASQAESSKGFVVAQTQPSDRNPNIPRAPRSRADTENATGGGTGSSGDSGGGAGGGAGGGGGGAGGGGGGSR